MDKNKSFGEQMILFNKTTDLPISLYSSSFKLLESFGLLDYPVKSLGKLDLESLTYNMKQDFMTYVSPCEEQYIVYKLVSNSETYHYLLLGPYKHFPYSTKKIDSIMILNNIPKYHSTTLYKYYYSLKTVKAGSITYYLTLVETLFQNINPTFSSSEENLLPFENMEKTFLEYREIDFYHHNYYYEKKLLNQLFKEKEIPVNEYLAYQFETGTIAKNHIRNVKNLRIIIIGIIERYAIDKGLDPHISFTMGDAYLRAIEDSDNISDIDIYVYEAAVKFKKALHLATSKKYSNTINKVIHYIDENLTQKLTLKDVAQYVHLHPKYLSKIFLQETGVTFTDYVLNEKIKEAKLLLDYSTHSLTEISDILAYSSKSYFFKCFKKVVGMTPREYLNTKETQNSI